MCYINMQDVRCKFSLHGDVCNLKDMSIMFNNSVCLPSVRWWPLLQWPLYVVFCTFMEHYFDDLWCRSEWMSRSMIHHTRASRVWLSVTGYQGMHFSTTVQRRWSSYRINLDLHITALQSQSLVTLPFELISCQDGLLSTYSRYFITYIHLYRQIVKILYYKL